MKPGRMTKPQLIEALDAANARITELEARPPGAGKSGQDQDLKYFRLWFQKLPFGAVHNKIIYRDGMPVDYIFLDANNAWETLVGKPIASGKKVSEIFPNVHQNSPELVETLNRVAAEGTPEKFETYSPVLQKWFQVWAYSPEKGEVISIFDDITREKRLEQEIDEKNRLLRKVGDVAKVGGWFWDSRYSNRGVWTDTVSRIFGIEDGQSLDVEDALNCFVGEGRSSMQRAVEAAVASATPYDLELELLDRKGQKKFIRAIGIPNVLADGGVTLHGIVQDITDRVKSERMLRESEVHYRSLFENMLNGSAYAQVLFDGVRPVDILFVEVNSAFEDITGLKDVSGEKISDVLPDFLEKDRDLFELLSEVARTGIPHQVEYHLESLDQWHTISAFSTKDAFFFVTIQDITERKNTEIRLQHSSKMEAIGTLAGGIAHDFNNILSAIIGYADLARLAPDDREKLDQRLGEVLQAGIRARELVKQILTFSRQTAAKMAPVNIAPLIRETLKFLKASLPATIEIREKFRGGKNLVMGDPIQIHQIVMNLCTNAAHAMRKGGGILDVQLTEVFLEDELDPALAGLEDGPYIKLMVADTGCGIPKEILPKIFDPFFTTKERGEGTGMGLSVVHGIVGDMKGRISIFSTPGRGTTINIFFPRCEGKEPPIDASGGPAERGTGHILLVDDNPQVLTSAHGILKLLGYQVTAMSTPLMAIEYFESNPDACDLVVTDMTMPKMTGLELSERILRIRPDMPIVLCTGFSPGLTIEEIRKAGIRELVMKPVNARELANAVSSAMGSQED